MSPPVHVILQTRMGSSRLPGKALLPIAGLPSAVLAGLRASRSGLPLTVATSTRSSDDRLAEAFKASGLPVFRGDEDDVLGRFIGATRNLAADTILVRLTGDNVFPDADFIALLLEALIASDVDIMSTQSSQGLPYGLSAEAFALSALREAAENTVAPLDREHVTPWLYRNKRVGRFKCAAGSRDLSCARCTLDIPDDYQTLQRIFSGIDDPVGIAWRELVDRLANLPDAPKFCVPRNRHGGSTLVLGTAQLGAPYGSVRKTQAPSRDEAIAMVRSAIRHGITQIDTAQAYPGSEALLGTALADGWDSLVQIITKLAPLDALPLNATEREVVQAVDTSILQSRQRLNLKRLPVLLLHRAAHLHAWDGAVWKRLVQLRDEGLIGLLGVSVQTVEEARVALGVLESGHIQLACNILDTRWEDAGIPALAAARPDVTIHARGALLQGVLLAQDVSGWPRIPGLDSNLLSRWLAEKAILHGRRNLLDLCYAWLRAQNWIDAIVVGMESERQVNENAAMFAASPLDQAAIEDISRTRPCIPETLLNPALWPGMSR